MSLFFSQSVKLPLERRGGGFRSYFVNEEALWAPEMTGGRRWKRKGKGGRHEGAPSVFFLFTSLVRKWRKKGLSVGSNRINFVLLIDYKRLVVSSAEKKNPALP